MRSRSEHWASGAGNPQQQTGQSRCPIDMFHANSFKSATLIDTTEKYLDEASAVKQYCTCQTFSLCLPWAYAICHGYIYYALITLSFLLAFTAAFTETYPRNTAKPDSVKITDVVGALIVFAISIAVTIFPRIEKYAYIAAGISGLLHKVA